MRFTIALMVGFAVLNIALPVTIDKHAANGTTREYGRAQPLLGPQRSKKDAA
jgi:hypothetical protein